jgi:A/G-specific adenine glycosylase
MHTKITPLLERWFDIHKRPLAFRESNDPYYIWVSEVMLQQTQVETMLPYYKKFITLYPSIESLASAPLESVLTSLQGIGYYRRFRLMHQGAIYIVEKFKSKFPITYEDVLSIPGVGQYTAGAIMSIAYNQPYAATDGNVFRVVSRLYGIEGDLTKSVAKKKIEQLNQSIVETGRPSIITPALMELGALVCRPLSPKCEECPVQPLCKAFKENKTNSIPFVKPKKTAKNVEFTTLIITDGKRIILTKNKETLLQEMYLLPQTKTEDYSAILSKYSIIAHSVDEIGLIKHTFTHQQWWMQGIVIRVKNLNHQEAILWNDLTKIPIPEAHKKVLKAFIKFDKEKRISI